MNALFKRGPLLGPRFILLVALSIGLMMWDYRGHLSVEKMRSSLALITTPLVYIANAPFAIFDSVTENFQSRRALLTENISLRAQSLILQGQLQKLQALQAENQELRELLQSTPAINHVPLMVAQVLAVSTSPFQQVITLNKGSQSGVYIGQAVLDAHGIMGQVIQVTPYTSQVLLIIDPRSGVPIRDNRTGLQGIVQGRDDSGELAWVDVVPTVDVQTGDVLVSSGLGGTYPVGYPVGVVTKVNRHTDDQFLQIDVRPSAQMNSNEQVLLVWPDKKAS